ncbi:hypothetical protein, partial [Burkholderia oklahomensis]|uniref:hypothetical protein n=1 Tax=Burkholderia oklahomensis TaxID=342113 RepID=UPI001E5E4A79
HRDRDRTRLIRAAHRAAIHTARARRRTGRFFLRARRRASRTPPHRMRGGPPCSRGESRRARPAHDIFRVSRRIPHYSHGALLEKGNSHRRRNSDEPALAHAMCLSPHSNQAPNVDRSYFQFLNIRSIKL